MNKIPAFRSLLVIVSAVIIVICCLAIPHTETMNVWIPGEDTIFPNEISKGNYTNSPKVYISGTAVEIPIEDYRKKYIQGDLTKNSITVEEPSFSKWGGIYYIGKTNEEIDYVAKIDYRNQHLLTVIEGTLINGKNNGELEIMLLYRPHWFFVIIFLAITLIAGAMIGTDIIKKG